MKTIETAGLGRVIACEGLDMAGKTTVSKQLAEVTGSRYHYFTDNNPLAKYRKRVNKLPPIPKFLYYMACAVDTYKQAEEFRQDGDVYLDRTIASTIAYHLRLGVPDWMIALVPRQLLNQLDAMLYFTCSEQTRSDRAALRGKELQPQDIASFSIARQVDRNYRELMPERTIVVPTDVKAPAQIVYELHNQLY